MKKIIIKILILFIFISMSTYVYGTNEVVENEVLENTTIINSQANETSNEIANENTNTVNENTNTVNENTNTTDNNQSNSQSNTTTEKTNTNTDSKTSQQEKKPDKIASTSISFNYSHKGTLNSEQNILKEANTNSKKIIGVKKGKKVTILSKSGSFFKVKYKQNNKKYTGYILTKHIKLTPDISIKLGNKKTLKTYITPKKSTDKIKFKSSNTKIATVTSSGKVTTKKPGIVVITARTESGKEDFIVIEIKKINYAKKITLKSEKYFKAKKSYKLSYKITPANAVDKITWKSSNTKIATITKNGKLKAKKAGIVKITVKTSSGKKSSKKIYIYDKNVMILNKKSSAIAGTYKNVKRIVYGKSVLGESLEAYEIKGNGKNSKVMFIEAAVHGYEDEYPKDAKILVKLSNELIEYYAKNPNKLKNYTLVIVPCANPDGTLYGKNNFREEIKNAFGRCTYKHIDINRDFISSKFKAKESKALKKLMKKYAKKMKVHLDLHGWEDSVIGDNAIVRLFRKFVGNTVDKSGRYGHGKGYVISYTKTTYGAHSALVEFKNSKKVFTSDVKKALNNIVSLY